MEIIKENSSQEYQKSILSTKNIKIKILMKRKKANQNFIPESKSLKNQKEINL